MKFISFFAGIGGIDLGLERAGHECVAQCEIDPYAVKVLEKHWPDVRRFGDITKVNADELPRADMLVGGFPCQDISSANAGDRSGLEGKHSGLWFEYYRLICDIRPEVVLVENVPALLIRGMPRVLSDLAYVGYDAEWEVLPAASVGAPHLRARVFLCAYTSGLRDRLPEGSVFARREGVKLCSWWQREPRLARLANGLSPRLDRHRKRCLGNAVVPQVAEYIGKLLKETEK